jgi:hypothetical protein
MKIAAAIAVVVCIALLAALVAASLLMSPGAPITTSAPMPTAAPEPAPAAAEVAPEVSEEPPWVVVEHDGQPLTAESLPGTDWHAGPYTLSFRDDGLVVVNRRFPGNWRLVADALAVEAQGQTLHGTLSGSSLTFEGREAERITFTESPDALQPRTVGPGKNIQ